MADETIQYRRYNTCICSYLTSGITGALRYRYEKIGNARVFYPYVLDEQFERFNKGQGIIPIERCKDKLSHFYAEWDNFLLCFTPEGKVDRMCDYLVYIADGKAGYIPLTGDIQLQKPIDECRDRHNYYLDLQVLLLKGLSWKTNEFHGYSVYYRTIFNRGVFLFDKEPVPFDILFSVLKSGEFTKEALFLGYTLGVCQHFSVEELYDCLNRCRRRFVNVVERHWNQEGAKDILDKEWCFHTRLLFERYTKQKLSKKQSNLVDRVLGYCNDRLKKTDLVNTRSGVPHLSLLKPTVDVKKLYAALVREGFISADTGEEQFVYYMTGEALSIPTEKIKWYGTNVKLVFLIHAIEGYGSCEWRIVSQIFESAKTGELRPDSLRNTYSKTLRYSKKQENEVFFDNLVKNL